MSCYAYGIVDMGCYEYVPQGSAFFFDKRLLGESGF